jgi:hypothetical protein
MRWLWIVIVGFAVVTAHADDEIPDDLAQAWGKLFPMDAVACREGVPDDCICGAYENPRGLQIRYSRVQGCPHPVFKDVVHLRTFTVDGELHGIEIRYDETGHPEAVIARNHGEPDRERSAELAQSLGLESPLRDIPESPAGPD